MRNRRLVRDHRQKADARSSFHRRHGLIARLLLTLAFITPLATLGIGRASVPMGNVTVKFGLSAEGSDQYVPEAATNCRVPVPYGSNGIVLLRAARARGCISSFVLEGRRDYYGTPLPGHDVKCIDSLCGGRLMESWDALETPNRSGDLWYDNFGLEAFHATQGVRVVFSFYGYVPFCPCI